MDVSLHLLTQWNMRIIEDYENEATVASTIPWPMKLLEEDGRRAVWNMCSVLGVDDYGVPGQACRLLERYILKHMYNFASSGVDAEGWQNFKKTLTSQVPLLMASCVQLAAKMSSARVQMNASIVRAYLLCKGAVFSISEVIESEFQVFSTLDFRVPLWTSVEITQMLAVEVGLPTSAMDGVALVVNIAEYRRDRITDSVRNIVNVMPSSNFNAGNLSTLHLAAGAAAASAKYLSCKVPDPVPKLAKLTQAPNTYIKCVGDIILADVLLDDTRVEERTLQSRKRKRSPLHL